MDIGWRLVSNGSMVYMQYPSFIWAQMGSNWLTWMVGIHILISELTQSTFSSCTGIGLDFIVIGVRLGSPLN